MAYEGTVKPAAGFNVENDAQVLRKAMKGLGTDEKAIIDIVAYRSSDQRQQILTAFKTMFGKDLLKDLKSETGGNFRDLLMALMMKPADYDASEIREAIKGLGTDESALIEILCTRSNAQVRDITDAYKRLYGKKLEDDVSGDTSGHFRRLLISMTAAGRMENQPVDGAKAKVDAKKLYEAGEGRLGTDESCFNMILAMQSYEQLAAVFNEYEQLAKKSIERAIDSEFSGDIKHGLLTIVKCVRNRPAYFAEKLYKAMKGLGTKDRTLIRVAVSRCEVDMVQIKSEFHRNYNQPLEKFIEDDTSGDYKRCLVALVRNK